MICEVCVSRRASEGFLLVGVLWEQSANSSVECGEDDSLARADHGYCSDNATLRGGSALPLLTERTCPGSLLSGCDGVRRKLKLRRASPRSIGNPNGGFVRWMLVVTVPTAFEGKWTLTASNASQ